MARRVTLHPSSEGDFERLLELRNLVMREHLERLGRFHPERSRARFRDGYAVESMRLIHVDGRFAGCVTMKRGMDAFEIERFYIDAPFQGQGVGAAVLALLLAEADATGLPVRLGVLRLNPAARLYERHGFRQVREEEWDIYYERPVPGG